MIHLRFSVKSPYSYLLRSYVHFPSIRVIGGSVTLISKSSIYLLRLKYDIEIIDSMPFILFISNGKNMTVGLIRDCLRDLRDAKVPFRGPIVHTCLLLADGYISKR